MVFRYIIIKNYVTISIPTNSRLIGWRYRTTKTNIATNKSFHLPSGYNWERWHYRIRSQSTYNDTFKFKGGYRSVEDSFRRENERKESGPEFSRVIKRNGRRALSDPTDENLSANEVETK